MICSSTFFEFIGSLLWYRQFVHTDNCFMRMNGYVFLL
jgi:hypothetical protein